MPAPKNINSSSIIHGAMDNFDHKGNTLSGVGGSHDTVLVLFQKPDMVETQELVRSLRISASCWQTEGV